MLLLSRLRFALARRPWLYWVFVAICVAIVWSTVAAKRAELDKQRAAWGETRRVWVATADVVPGDEIRAAARDYPIAMLPTSATDEEPIGLIATTSIAKGEVLVASDVDSTTNPLTAPGSVVFAVENDGAPVLRQGDSVAIFGSGQRWCDGVVIATSEDRLELAVPATCADAISLQVAADAIVVGLTTR